MAVIHTIGRRKTSIARIYLDLGNGAITVNNRDFKEYFPTGPLQYIVTQAQLAVNQKENYDIKINVDGGGIKNRFVFVSRKEKRSLASIVERQANWTTEREARVVLFKR